MFVHIVEDTYEEQIGDIAYNVEDQNTRYQVVGSAYAEYVDGVRINDDTKMEMIEAVADSEDFIDSGLGNEKVELDWETRSLTEKCLRISVNDWFLGSRDLKVIHTPSHSEDSIMLFDEKNRILFTGDTFYKGALYAHFEGDFYGNSNIQTYYNTISELVKLIPRLNHLYCSHNEPVVNPEILSDVVSQNIVCFS